jgi:hypothetical protein
MGPQMGANRERFAALEGACGVQTFYMTQDADEPKNTRDRASAQRFASGLP